MDKYLKKLFPQGSSYKKEDWYKLLEKRASQFRTNLLRRTLLASLLVPFLVVLLNYIYFSEAPLFFNSLILLGILILYLVSFYFKGPWFYRLVFLFLYAVVLCSALWAVLPLYLIFIVILPILSINILEGKEAVFISLLFLFTQVLISLCVPNDSFLNANPHFLVYIVAAFSIILSLSMVIYKQSHGNLQIILRNTLFDKVTNLPVQKVLKNHCADILNQDGVFAIIKIANFEELGLIFGYELSDTILVYVARFLEELGSKMGFKAYRLRGNEFGVLKCVSKGSITEASAFLLSLQKRVENLIINWNQSHLTLYMVIGGSMVDDKNPEYLSQADLAVKEGMERHVPVVLYSDECVMKDLVLSSLNHYSVLKDNLDEQTLQAYYQPIIDSGTNNVIWYETLLRVKEKDGTMSSPIPYLPVAESTGLDRHISDFVLVEACKALEILNTHISVNVGLNDLKRPEFLNHLITHFPKNRKGEGTLIIEILERQELHTLGNCQNFLQTAKELGCLIAIDDFGSGYSNYSNLLEIPIDIIKIDGELVQQLQKNEKARVLVHNIIQFSKKLNLKVVAEYVDNHDTADMLKSLGVDFFQGWLYGKAQPLSYHRTTLVNNI